MTPALEKPVVKSPNPRQPLRTILVALLALGSLSAPACAQSVEEFYNGKSIISVAHRKPMPLEQPR